MSSDVMFDAARERRGKPPARAPGAVTVPNSIVAELFEIARRRGYYDTELANVLGYSPTAVMYWRNGRSKPNIEGVVDLAQFLGYRLKLEKVS